MNHSQRRGRVHWITSAAIAGIMGTAGVVGTMALKPSGPKSAPTFAVESSVNSPTLEDAFLGATEEESTSIPSQPALKPSPSKKKAKPSEAVSSERASSERSTAAMSIPAGGAARPEGIAANLDVASPQNSATSAGVSSPDFFQVNVFFATDREQIDPKSWILWTRILAPMILGCLICMVMLIAVLRGFEKWLWGIGLTLGAALTILFSYHALIYGQQARRLAANGSTIYGSRRYEATVDYPLHLGVGQVTIPKIHKKGSVEQPQLLHLEFHEDPSKHVMLQAIESLQEEEYFDALRAELSRSKANATFIFIHGYNVQFAEALSRTAQIKHDLEFDGPAILYSWPSHGELLAYSQDGDNANWTVAHLERFLLDVKKKTNAKDIHVIAHSMGNRALVGALQRLSQRRDVAQPILTQLVMAAPDVDAAEFAESYAKPVNDCSRQATLYTSSTDRALQVSMRLHGYPRLGISEGTPRRFEGIDTVEVSPIDPSLLGHSYYGSHPLLIRDLQAIIELGEPPTLRQWLIPYTDSPTKLAWRFSPKISAEASLNR